MPGFLQDFYSFFYYQLIPALDEFWKVFRNWWWIFPPFILWKPFIYLYLWWRVDVFLAQQKFIMLEIKMPKDLLKPIRAMETVFSGLWQMHDAPNPREKWFEGKRLLSYSFEIVSIGGQIHFFVRIPAPNRNLFESQIYSQYPEAEISDAEDYTKYIPQSVPNDEWDLWGWNYKLRKTNPYPIRTYTEFETEREALEEKRIDPIASLLEGMSKMRPGEQLWIQIMAKPVIGTGDNADIPWVKEGEGIRDKIARRPDPAKQKSMFVEAADLMISGTLPGTVVKEERDIIPPEMKLTPGEKNVITGVERKISKFGFDTSIRFIYLGKRDIFFRANVRLPMSYFTTFNTNDMNSFVPIPQTITKRHTILTWYLDKRRVYLRKRKLFKNYIKRDTAFHPLSGGTFILNTEELATIMHFPSRISSPAALVSRIEAKKGEAPPGLPVE